MAILTPSYLLVYVDKRAENLYTMKFRADLLPGSIRLENNKFLAKLWHPQIHDFWIFWVFGFYVKIDFTVSKDHNFTFCLGFYVSDLLLFLKTVLKYQKFASFCIWIAMVENFFTSSKIFWTQKYFKCFEKKNLFEIFFVWNLFHLKVILKNWDYFKPGTST